jgi:hypothetical protein
MRHWILNFASLLLFLPAIAPAGTINLGLLSFDNLIPAGDSPGVNVFDLGNFTGPAWSLPPDFPVITELAFQNSMFDLVGSAGSLHILLGDIGPGLLNAPSSLQFPDTATFTVATFSATLSNPFLQLADGSAFTAATGTISATLVPSLGDTLLPGDFAILSASDATASPEPGTSALIIGGLGLLVPATLKRRKKG